MRQNLQVDTATTPTRQNPFSPRSRTPSPTRAYTPHKQLFSPAKKATTPTPITPASKWRNPAKSPASAEKKTPASALYPSTDAPEFKWKINSTPTKAPAPKTTSEIELGPPLRELAESLQAELDAPAPLQEIDSSGKPTSVDAKQQSMFVGKNGRVLEALRIRKTVWSGSVGFGLLNVPTPSKDQFRGLVGVDIDAGWNDFDEGLSFDKSVEVEGEDEGLDLGSLRKERLNKAFRNGKRFV
ncbi:hypothetical protein HDU99_010667 [Rhizoclosmatium hyalinum]|nr:hypothetical protein HDU99_010667 [Rhizoclosmatium hyalinum]